MTKKVIASLCCAGVLLVIIGFFAGVYLSDNTDLEVASPAIFNQDKPKELPLLEYTFPQLRARSYQPSTIVIEEQTASLPEFTTYTFSYTTMGKKMTGQLNIPATVTSTTPVIVMLRGYVPLEIYSTGVGTKNAAAVFAKNGFITIAPDFFGYGGSDPEPTDSDNT